MKYYINHFCMSNSKQHLRFDFTIFTTDCSMGPSFKKILLNILHNFIQTKFQQMPQPKICFLCFLDLAFTQGMKDTCESECSQSSSWLTVSWKISQILDLLFLQLATLRRILVFTLKILDTLLFWKLFSFVSYARRCINK